MIALKKSGKESQTLFLKRLNKIIRMEKGCWFQTKSVVIARRPSA